MTQALHTSRVARFFKLLLRVSRCAPLKIDRFQPCHSGVWNLLTAALCLGGRRPANDGGCGPHFLGWSWEHETWNEAIPTALACWKLELGTHYLPQCKQQGSIPENCKATEPKQLCFSPEGFPEVCRIIHFGALSECTTRVQTLGNSKFAMCLGQLSTQTLSSEQQTDQFRHGHHLGE